MQYLIIVILTVLAVASQPAWAAEKVSKVQLPSEIVTNKVNSIIRTSDGLMWIGTASGLSRYDGFTYLNFQSVPTDTTTLRSNYVAELTEDPRGWLWIKTDEGFSIYDFASEKISNDVASHYAAMGLPSETERILADIDNNLWMYLSSPGALYVLRPGKQQVELVDGEVIGQKNISGIALSDNYLVMVNRRGQIILVDRQKGEVAAVIEDIVPQVDENRNPEIQVYVDRDNMVWLWTGTDLWLYDLRDRILIDLDKMLNAHRAIVRVIVQDIDGRIWIGHDHRGVVLLEKQGGRGNYAVSKEQIPELDRHTVTCFYSDRNGSMWVGTYKHGLFCYGNAINQFDLAPVPDVNVIVPADFNEAWVGTDGDGLWLWNSATGRLEQMLPDRSNDDHSAITSLADDGKGGVYVGTYGRGLQHYSNGKMSHVENQALGDADIWALLPYGQQRMWVGTLGKGLVALDLTTGEATHYTEESDGLPSNFISSLSRSQNGQIYIGTGNGVGILDPSSGKVSCMPNDELSSPFVNQVMCDSRGMVWLATRSGLDMYSPSTEKITKVNLFLASPQPHVLGLAEDHQGQIWVSVGSMLCCLTIANTVDLHYSLNVFNNSDGLTLSDFNQRSLCVLPNGALAVGGLYGISYCQPGQLSGNATHAKVIFTGLSIDGRTVTPGQRVDGHVIIDKSIVQSPRVNLYGGENNVTIFFSSDNYIVLERTRFYYQLSGRDTDWTPCPAGSHYLNLNGLPPGKYQLRVKAVNSDDLENVSPAELEIVVHQPFWTSIWAYIIYGLVLLAIIALAYYFMRRREQERLVQQRQEEELEKQEQLNQMKLRFFTNISHELRTPLTLIISPLEKMISETQDPLQLKKLNTMHRNSTQLLSLVNQIMDFRKSEMYGLQLSTSRDDLIAFAENVMGNFKPMAESKNITLKFISEQDSFITKFDKDKLSKMLVNLMSNALKFTPNGGLVVMTIDVEPDWVKMSVKDNGIGVSDEDKPHLFERFFQSKHATDGSYAGTGIGLNMVWEYVRLHGGSVHVEDNPEGQGAVFVVDLPLKREDEEPEPTDAEIKQSEPVDNGKPAVLVVDDNNDIIELISDMLGDEYNVESAANGKEAWLKIREHKPALIISDIMMPVMDGIELCRKVKSEPATASVPLILLTAKQDVSSRLAGLTMGADDYITKPFNNEELKLRVRKMLQLTQSGAQRQVLDPKPTEIKITSLDEKLVEKAVKYVEDNMDRNDLSVEELAQQLGMSRVHLYKKLTQITGKSPVEFIRLLRLKRAAQLLRESQLNISEIAFATGFGSPKYFSKYFREEYGILPSAYQQSYGK